MKLGKINTSLIFLSIASLLLVSCYRIPEEGEYSVIPATNNPSVVGTHGTDNLLPASGF